MILPGPPRRGLSASAPSPVSIVGRPRAEPRTNDVDSGGRWRMVARSRRARRWRGAARWVWFSWRGRAGWAVPAEGEHRQRDEGFGKRNPNAIRVSSRILVLTDSMRPWDRP